MAAPFINTMLCNIVVSVTVAPSPTRNINSSWGDTAQNHAERYKGLCELISHFLDLGLINLWSNR